MTATAGRRLLGAVELPEDPDLDVLRVWDEALRSLVGGLDAVTFRSPAPPDRLLVTVPAPLFAAWADWADGLGRADGVGKGATTDGAGTALLVAVDGVEPVARVEPQTDADRRFLGEGAVFVMAGDGRGGWCERTVNLPVAEVVRRHLVAGADLRRTA